MAAGSNRASRRALTIAASAGRQSFASVWTNMRVRSGSCSTCTARQSPDRGVDRCLAAVASRSVLMRPPRRLAYGQARSERRRRSASPDRHPQRRRKRGARPSWSPAMILRRAVESCSQRTSDPRMGPSVLQQRARAARQQLAGGRRGFPATGSDLMTMTTMTSPRGEVIAHHLAAGVAGVSCA